jgi:hypothetical protein
MKHIIFLIVFLAVGSGLGSVPDRPVPRKQWTDSAKVWTARSCVGEAGFASVDECIAIAWVYATRAKESPFSYLKIVRRYSAATKAHERHRRVWLFNLGLDGKKPDGWPEHLSWRVHKPKWMHLLETLDRWSVGAVPNPVPGANHYGSREDANRAQYVRKWKRLDTPDNFKNWFFDSRIKVQFFARQYVR